MRNTQPFIETSNAQYDEAIGPSYSNGDCGQTGFAQSGANYIANGNAARPDTTYMVTKGTYRFLRGLGYSPLPEFKLATGRRADIGAVNAKGHIIMVEIKSCAADYVGDNKWTDYVGFCDAFYFAVAPDFPQHLLPDTHGLIIADPYGAIIKRPAIENKLTPARRKAVTLRLTRQALARLRPFGNSP